MRIFALVIVLLLSSGAYSRFLQGSCAKEYFCGLNGTCYDGDFENKRATHWCSCDDGYGGVHCEKKCELVCQKDHKCMFDSLGRQVCVCKGCDANGIRLKTCPVGSGGENCSKRGWCYPNQCLNGGQCVGEGAEAKCVCPSGLKGRRCEEDVDECENEDSCFNGRCVNSFRSYECICEDNYRPPECAVERSPGNDFEDETKDMECIVQVSDEYPEGKAGVCSNYGICVTDSMNRSTCACPPGFGGELCERDLDECSFSPCMNGATCSNFRSGFQCFCLAGFEGEFCEINQDECVNNKCAHGSKCVDGIGRYTCECPEGQIGLYCEFSDPCSPGSEICGPHGTCMPNRADGSFTCSCNTGFEGQFCDIDIDICAEFKENPCRNGGTCVDQTEHFKCDCTRGYNGTYCEEPVNLCEAENVVCSNGGKCYRGPDMEPICVCNQGFIGRRCETACPPGMVGVHCDIRIGTPVCGGRLGKCFNSGHCSKGMCNCPPSFTGNHCETHRKYAIDSARSCDTIPCLGNATCVDVNDDIGYVCLCPPGLEGDICQNVKNYCSQNPCYNGGKCVRDEQKGYECVCPSGFEGPECQDKKEIDCRTSRCFNGGECVTEMKTNRCECPKNFIGSRCEQRIDFWNSDVIFRKVCDSRNCSARAGDGNCDMDCNIGACNFDGGDCNERQRPFAQCRYGNMCEQLFANGECNQACNNEECLYDGMDCMPRVPRCPVYIREHCASHFADGICNEECNSDGCGWDGGDCEAKSNVTMKTISDIRVKILLPPTVFQREGGNLLMNLSRELRSIFRIQRDEIGPLVFEWNGYEDEKMQVPIIGERILMNVADLEEHKLVSNVVRTRRAASRVDGVLVWLEVEPIRGDGAVFSDAESVVNYLTAGMVKEKGKASFGVPIVEAMVMKPSRSGASGEETFSNMCLLIIGAFIVIGFALGGIALYGDDKRSRKRRIISAPVWMPPTEQENEKMKKSEALSSSQNSLLGCGSGPVVSTYYDIKKQRIDNSNYPMMTGHYQGMYQNPHIAAFAADYGGYGNTDMHMHIHARQQFMSPQMAHQQPAQPVTQTQGTTAAETSKKNEPSKLHAEAAGPEEITVELTKENVNEKDSKYGRTVLHWLVANSNGKEEIIIAQETAQCVNAGAEVNALDSDMDTPLMLAVRAKRARVVIILMKAGADPTIFNKSERSALHEACVNLDFRMVQLLLTNQKLVKEIDELDKCGRTALMEVARLDRDTTIAELLLNSGAIIEADGSNRKESDVFKGRTALHYAAQVNNLPMVEYLVSKNANKDKQDELGMTPIMLAAKEGHLDCVRMLIDQGASLETTDQMDKTARQLAVAQYHYDVVELIDVMMEKSQMLIDDAARQQRQIQQQLQAKLHKPGRPSIKAVKRSASRKTNYVSASPAESVAHMTPPPSDGSISSPSPTQYVPNNNLHFATSPLSHYPMGNTNNGMGLTVSNMSNTYPQSNASTSSCSGASSMTGTSHVNGVESSPEYHPQDSEMPSGVSGTMWYGHSPPYMPHNPQMSYGGPCASAYDAHRYGQPLSHEALPQTVVPGPNHEAIHPFMAGRENQQLYY